MEFEAIADGIYLEALAVDEETVWFSDVAAGGMNRLGPDGRIATWLPDRKMIGSALVNHDGAILCSGPGGIAWFDPGTGQSGMLLDNIAGQPVPGVNEMCPDGCGGIYFGTVDLPAILKGAKPGPVGLYHLSQDRTLRLLVDGLAFSNGIGLSADRTRLYHNETFVGTSVYHLDSDGSIVEQQSLLEKPDCDGMAVDAEDHVWITGFASNEILRLSPSGSIAERLPVPGEGATNVRFGGADGQQLLVNTVAISAAQDLGAGRMPEMRTSILFRGHAGVAGQKVRRASFSL